MTQRTRRKSRPSCGSRMRSIPRCVRRSASRLPGENPPQAPPPAPATIGPRKARSSPLTRAERLGIAALALAITGVPTRARRREQMPLYMKAADYRVVFLLRWAGTILCWRACARTARDCQRKGRQSRVVSDHGVNGLLALTSMSRRLASALEEVFATGRRVSAGGGDSQRRDGSLRLPPDGRD